MKNSDPLGSVLIAAWNEATVIERTLDVLYDGVNSDDFAVVVACNGCTDGTEDVVRSTGYPVKLLSLATPGKSAAIRSAEAVTDVLPRVYLDADTQVTGPAMVVMLTALSGGHLAARPPVRFDTSHSTRPVRRFYAVRSHLPGVMHDLCGAGVYGLSAEARGRFADFPDVIADDLFAARMVSAAETTILDCDAAVVTVPHDARSLVRTLSRVYRGNREIARLMPEHRAINTATTGRQLLDHLRLERRIVDVVTYSTLVLAGRLLSLRDQRRWQRDDSTRITV